MYENDSSRPASTLERLEQTIDQRRRAAAAGQGIEHSYTAQLLAAGLEKIGAKVTEEAAELVEAADESGEPGREHTIHEAADLVYHLLVLLGARDIRLAEVEAELARREGTSGLAEKAARGE